MWKPFRSLKKPQLSTLEASKCRRVRHRQAALVELLDVFPTLVHIAGLPQPQNKGAVTPPMGKSLLPVMMAARHDENEAALGPEGDQVGHSRVLRIHIYMYVCISLCVCVRARACMFVRVRACVSRGFASI